MTTSGRRGSRDFGWEWSRPPAGFRQPPSSPPLLPLAGVALLFASFGAILVGVWLASSDSVTAPPTATATATATAQLTPTPTPLPTPSPPPTSSPEPSPTPTAVIEPDFSLEIWASGAWHADVPAGLDTFREGAAIPLMLRIDRARPGDTYGITLRYTCRSLQFLSAYDRDSGGGPALAPGGPLTLLPDSLTRLPDDPATPADDGERERLSLWGGPFGPVELADGSGPCANERRLNVSLLAGRDTLFLLWGAVVAPGAAEAGLPLRVNVLTPQGERHIEIDPASVTPSP